MIFNLITFKHRQGFKQLQWGYFGVFSWYSSNMWLTSTSNSHCSYFVRYAIWRNTTNRNVASCYVKRCRWIQCASFPGVKRFATGPRSLVQRYQNCIWQWIKLHFPSHSDVRLLPRANALLIFRTFYYSLDDTFTDHFCSTCLENVVQRWQNWCFRL